MVTTHLKKGWIRRNGVPRSDQAELTEYFYRHGEFLTWTVIINDPLYLTEPMIRTTDYRLAPTQNVGPYPCLIVEEIDSRKFPHRQENPDPEESAKAQKVPVEAAGGAGTTLPEYRKRVARQPVSVDDFMKYNHRYILPGSSASAIVFNAGAAQQRQVKIFDPQQGIYYADANDRSRASRFAKTFT